MTEPDPFWRDVVADHRPRPRELLHSESELAATPATPLPPPQVEAICRKVDRTMGATPRRRWRSQRVAAAIVLATSLVTAGWIGALVIRPTTVPTPLRLNNAGALAESKSAPAEADRFLAVSLLDDHCVRAAKRLQDLTAHDDAQLAEAAAAARATMLAFAQGSHVPPGPDQDPNGLVDIAIDEQRPMNDRIAAIRKLPAALSPSLATLRDARFDNERSAKMRDIMMTRVVRLLGAVDASNSAAKQSSAQPNDVGPREHQ